MENWSDINHPRRPRNDIPYSFPSHRECHWCHKQGLRSAGRWVTKSTWVCFTCLKSHSTRDKKEK